MVPAAQTTNGSIIPAAGACVAIVVAIMAWPGDVPWGGDDALLIKLALQDNAHHRMSSAGLGGSFGYPYGPIPLQIYQALLSITHYVPKLVELHAMLLAGTTATALLWLIRTLRWNAWLVPLAMLSPFFWFYSRLLWDNTFAIPVGSMLLAAYVSFLRRASVAKFTVGFSCGVVLPFIHPITLPLDVAVAAHLLWRVLTSMQRHKSHAPMDTQNPEQMAIGSAPGSDAELRMLSAPDRSLFMGALFPSNRIVFFRYLMAAFLIAAMASFSCGNYCARVVRQFNDSPRIPRNVSISEEQSASRISAMAFPLLSGRLLSAYCFFDSRGSEPGIDSTPLAGTARIISALAFPLVWLGMVVSLLRFRAGLQSTCDPADALMSICVLALLLQSIMDGMMRISPFPHYYCGTWIICVVCFWQGLRFVSGFRLARVSAALVIGVTYATATALATLLFAIGVHRAAGGTRWYGPTVQKQLNDLVVR